MAVEAGSQYSQYSSSISWGHNTGQSAPGLSGRWAISPVILVYRPCWPQTHCPPGRHASQLHLELRAPPAAQGSQVALLVAKASTQDGAESNETMPRVCGSEGAAGEVQPVAARTWRIRSVQQNPPSPDGLTAVPRERALNTTGVLNAASKLT